MFSPAFCFLNMWSFKNLPDENNNFHLEFLCNMLHKNSRWKLLFSSGKFLKDHMFKKQNAGENKFYWVYRRKKMTERLWILMSIHEILPRWVILFQLYHKTFSSIINFSNPLLKHHMGESNLNHATRCNVHALWSLNVRLCEMLKFLHNQCNI